MRTIFFDLDGTLLDVSEQLYRVYHDLVRELGGEPIDRPTYRQLKQARVTEMDIIRQSGLTGQEQVYLALRRKCIEQPEYLSYTRPFPDVWKTLRQLSLDHRLVLLTLRRLPLLVAEQLEAHDLARYFFEVRVCGVRPDGEPDWRTKARVIQNPPALPLEHAIVVGDTEADVLAGRALGLTTVGVTTGIRSAETLAIFQPDQIIGSLAELPGLV